jgi:hypothetical protein
MSALRASIKAADALAEKAVCDQAAAQRQRQRQTEASYAAAADAYKSALAQAIRGTPRGSDESKHCLLRMARLQRILGRLEEAAKAFGAYLAVCGEGDSTPRVFATYERMLCVLKCRMPALCAEMVRAYAETTYVLSVWTEGADTFLAGSPWMPSNGGRALCVSNGMLPSLLKAWGACEGDYASAAIAATTSETLLRLRDTTAMRSAARAALQEARWERATELLHEVIAWAASPAPVMDAIVAIAIMRYQQGRFKEAHAAASVLGPSAPPSVRAAATDPEKATCAEVAVASHMRSWSAGAVPMGWVERATAWTQFAVHLVYGTGVSPTYFGKVNGAEHVLMQTEDGWGDAFAACYLLNQGLPMTGEDDHGTGEQQSTHALQRCNDARIAEAKGEWSEAAALWEAALAKMCTPAVLRGVEGVDKSSMLCAHLMACPALTPAEQAAICEAWLRGYDRPAPLSLEALVAGRATFGEAVGSDADILAAILDRRDACAYGPHPARLRASRA